MGFLSALGKIAKIGGIAAAPFTGGASLLATGLGAAGDVASVLGKQQQGKSEGKAVQANLQQDQDRNAINLYQAQQGAENTAAQTDLDRKRFTTSDRGANAQQALVAKLLGNYDPARLDVPGVKTAQLSGGIGQALKNNPGLLATLAELAKKSDAAMSDPGAFQGGNMIKAPGLTALPQVDKGGFLSTLANIGQLVGAAAPRMQGTGDPGRMVPPPEVPVDGMGAIPGGAVVPRTVPLRLPSRPVPWGGG